MYAGRASLLGVATLVGSLLGAGCGTARERSAQRSADPSTADATPASTAGADDAAFARPGPYPVGVTTIDLDGRAIEVFYPAARGSERGTQRATYSNADALPDDLRAALTDADAGGSDPPASAVSFEMPAYRDLAASDDGPFPILLFSHSFGGWRLGQSSLTAGIASWGFVVAAIDHTERGLVSIVSGTAHADAAAEAEVAIATLDLIEADSASAGTALSGIADRRRVAAAGHSAGGATALALGNDARIGAIVAWAPAPLPEHEPSATPTMVIAAERDTAITPDVARVSYDTAGGRKAFVMIGRAGHNSFADICLQLYQGVDVFGAARQHGIPVPETLEQIATDGCSAENLDPRLAWSVTQHFTVAFLRSVFNGANASSAPDAGLGDGVVTAFDGVPVAYEHRP